MIYHSDCLDLIPKIKKKINLIYIDPPFFTQQDFKNKEGIVAFTDKWTMDYYLSYMKKRLILMREILEPTGSIYLHCDPTASHYLKVLMDDIFGKNNFRQDVIWYRYNKIDDKRKIWTKYHDNILCYSREGATTWNPLSVGMGEIVTRKKMRKIKGKIANTNQIITYEKTKCLTRSVIDDIPDINTENSKQRTGYPTQKPEALLERIIKISSNEGDLVADFFCGSGTTCAVAKKLNRRYIGCDTSSMAIKIAKERLGNY